MCPPGHPQSPPHVSAPYLLCLVSLSNFFTKIVKNLFSARKTKREILNHVGVDSDSKTEPQEKWGKASAPQLSFFLGRICEEYIY